MPRIDYRASRTVSRFLQDEHYISGIMGPVGSGKSVGCVVSCLQRMHAFDRLGLQSRGVVVRNSYRELDDSTLSTWLDWLGRYGEFKRSTMTHTIQLKHKHEVRFRALDKPQDLGKLLSTEYSWAWLNEVRELPLAVYDLIQTRVGRFPRREDYRHLGADFEPPFAIICDTNPPDDFHWFARLFVNGDTRPDNVGFYRQPGGLEPDAENLNNLRPGYYDQIVKGKDDAWIKVYVHGQLGFAVDGKPVWPMFNEARHVSQDSIEPTDAPLIVGMDFGLTPAAVFMQQSATGQWRVLSEVVTEDTAADEFGPLVQAHIGKYYASLPVEYWGDPAGSGRAQTDKNTPFRVLKASGIDARPAVTPGTKPNDFDVRVKAVSSLLLKLDMAAEPALIIDPACRYLKRGMLGGYKYRQINASGDEKYHPEPDKNIYSHVSEALQYALVGAGVGRAVVGYGTKRRPVNHDKRHARMI